MPINEVPLKREKKQTVEFKNLDIGKCFVFEGLLFRKTPDYYASEDGSEGTDGYNCFCINGAGQVPFSCDETKPVEPVELIEIVIR